MTDAAETRKPIDLVIASAGTGKTTRLVDEMRKAIDAGAATSSIMATTFTNKAAMELVERARSGLMDAGKVDQAASLLSARVGTVNATFGRIVGEFTLEAGRSPVADVISEGRQRRIFAIAAEEAISRHAGAMIPIARRLEIDDWEGDVRRLADLVRQNDIDPAELEDQAQRSWRGLAGIFPEPVQQGGAALNDQLRDALLRVGADLDRGSDTTKTTASVRAQITEANAILQSGRDLSWAEWARLAKLRPAKSSAAIVQPLVDIAGQHPAHPDLHADLQAYILGVYRTAAEALGSYARYKATNGLVDFVDQEQEALRLLDRPQVSERLRETLSRVFVDEFQDTSPIQLALFLKVSQIADRSFWVGDPKQAIYGFRDADPALIERAAQEVVPKSGGRRAALATSYRARPALVHFTNSLFAPAFEALGFAPESVRIEQCDRRDADGQGTPIEVWGLVGDNWKTALGALAEKIRTVLETPEAHAVEDRSLGGTRPIRGSDIAVLCRANSRCDEFAAALAQAGVRVSMTRPGLLDTPEAALAVAAFRYLVDPGDSLAIAEVAHFLDDAEDQPSWFERSLSEEGTRSLVTELPLLAALDEARGELAELTPSEALEVAITAPGLLDRLHAWGNGLDRIANLDALRGLAAQYEDEAGTLRQAATAAGLVTWLANSAATGNELPPSTDPAAVQVLTYHGAKGLEWPMVVLLDLDNAKDASAFGFHVEAPEEFDIWQPLHGRWLRFWPWPYGRQRKGVHIDASVQRTAECQAAAGREYAEAVRLLYVGMTRARDYLVLAPRDSAKHGLQLQWLDRLVGLDGNAVPDAQRLESEAVLMVAGEPVRAPFSRAMASDAPPELAPAPEALRRPEAATQPEHPPYWVAPSRAASPTEGDARVVSRVALGARIPLVGSPDMGMLGDAIHAFLAFDRPSQAAQERRERAERTLSRWMVRGLAAESLVEMSDRLFGHLSAAFPDMRTRAEVPVFARRGGQRIGGRVDLLLTGDAKAVIIDHKSYPGAFKTWEDRALGHGAQLALYAAAVRAATACVEVRTWVHMPVVGQLIEIDAGLAWDESE